MTLLDVEYYTYTLDNRGQSTFGYLINSLWTLKSALQKESACKYWRRLSSHLQCTRISRSIFELATSLEQIRHNLRQSRLRWNLTSIASFDKSVSVEVYLECYFASPSPLQAVLHSSGSTSLPRSGSPSLLLARSTLKEFVLRSPPSMHLSSICIAQD